MAGGAWGAPPAAAANTAPHPPALLGPPLPAASDIHMAFSDATGEPTRDTNPLLRRHSKLSATNPLL